MEKRLFIALKYSPDEQFLESYSAIRSRVNAWAKIKWVPSHQLHLTLCFLGNTDVSLIDSIETAINATCTRQQAFDARIWQLNIFSHQRQPRVLWMGLEPIKRFQQLQSLLLQQLMQEFDRIKTQVDLPRIETESHFTPHLTLGRFKTTYDLNPMRNYLASQSETVFGIWPVRQVGLYESILSPTGPTYHQLQVTNLQIV